jgi:cytoskeletal protein RodZ
VHVEAGVSVGEALAEARGAAGLSVDEVSERTAIREIVIRSIERDDFGSLGGDLYVRGYLRKIAGAVGIDPRPLIREFDATRSNGSTGWSAFGGSSSTAATTSAATATGAAGGATTPVAAPAVHASQAAGSGEAAGEPEAGFEAPGTGTGEAAVEALATTAGDSEAEPETAEEPEPGSARPAPGDPWADQGWTEPVAADAVWADPLPLEPADRRAPALPVSAIPPGTSATAASSAGRSAAASPVAPAGRPARRPRKPGRTRTRVRGWRWVITISGLTVVVLAIVAVAAAEIVSKVGTPNGSPSAAAASRSVPTAAPSVTATPATPAAVKSTPASKPTPTFSPKPPAPARRLAVQADGAFGPDGLGDGDNPQSASFAITSGAPAPWQTHWYTTADFGLLKHGTGLLLDMGKPVTITSVKLQLGPNWGADLQLRAGDKADLSEMPVVASKTDAGGQLTMRLKKPARARYMLIWFVKLPPSGGGTYTASVSQVMVEGHP